MHRGWAGLGLLGDWDGFRPGEGDRERKGADFKVGGCAHASRLALLRKGILRLSQWKTSLDVMGPEGNRPGSQPRAIQPGRGSFSASISDSSKFLSSVFLVIQIETNLTLFLSLKPPEPPSPQIHPFFKCSF